MTTVTEDLDLPGGVEPTNVVVTVYLAGEGGAALPEAFNQSTGKTIVGRHKLNPAADGTWSLELDPNGDLIPEGTVWARTVSVAQPGGSPLATVPASGPVRWDEILADPPGALATAALDALEDTLVRPAWTVVAASDAPAAMLARADVVCDGVDDQVEIEAALAVGNVQLTEGTYQLNPFITIDEADRWLRGVGTSTVIRTVAQDLSETPNVWGTVTVSEDRVWVTDLAVDGNRDAHTGTPGDPRRTGMGIAVLDCNDTLIERLHVHDITGEGIEWHTGTGSVGRNLLVETCGVYGLHVRGGLFDPTVRLTIAGATIRGTGIDDPARGGLGTQGAFGGTNRCHVSDVWVTGSVSGVGAVLGGNHNRYTRLSIEGADAGNRMAQSQDSIISDSRLEAFAIASSADNNLITSSRIDSLGLIEGTGNRLHKVTDAAGARSENADDATIDDGQTSVTVAHGLLSTPAVVTATARSVDTVAVTVRTATDITIARAGTSGALVVDWSATT